MNNVKLARNFLWVLILTTVCSRGFAMDVDTSVFCAQEVAKEVAKPGRFASLWNGLRGCGSTVGNSTVVQTPLNALSSAASYGWNGLKATPSTVYNGGSSVVNTVIHPVVAGTAFFNSAPVQGTLNVVRHPLVSTQAVYTVARNNPKTTLAVVGAVAATAYLGYKFLPNKSDKKQVEPKTGGFFGLFSKAAKKPAGITPEEKAKAITAVNTRSLDTFVSTDARMQALVASYQKAKGTTAKGVLQDSFIKQINAL